jgi:hypothetical protein
MNATPDEAAAIYARACRAWYGKRAPRIVKRRIDELRRAGDHEGVDAWKQVAAKLSLLQTSRSKVDEGAGP